MDVYIWGIGRDGLLGLGDDGRPRYAPTLLTDTNTGDKIELIHIECGGNHTVGLTKNGQVVSWGCNDYGQLGHGDEKERRVPTKVKALDGRVIIKVSCGAFHTVAITDKGELLTWGIGINGQLGHGNTWDQLVPKKVEALAKQVIVDVACGLYHTCVVTSTELIFAWGWSGGFGGYIEHGEYARVPLPRLLQDLSSKGVVSVSANWHHTACVTRGAGEVFTWGEGQYGKLGHGDETNQHTPKRVEALVGVKVTMVSCGENHSAVCTEDGHVHTFGRGDAGQLGHGDKENTFSPVLVKALEGKHITQVQCGEYHTMALTSSGYVFTWGKTKFGRLGHGNVNQECFSFPCLVKGLREHNVVQISSGDDHCAVLVNSTSPSPSIRLSQQDSINNQEHSDVVFMVEDQPMYGIVSVLTKKSDYFAAMFRSNMRESIEKVVNVPNCSKAAFLHVLKFLCLDDFSVSIDDVVELWGLADMYQMEGLKYSCMGALERGLSEENASQILQEVEDLSCPCDELRSMCHDYLDDHGESKNRRGE